MMGFSSFCAHLFDLLIETRWKERLAFRFGDLAMSAVYTIKVYAEIDWSMAMYTTFCLIA